MSAKCRQKFVTGPDTNGDGAGLLEQLPHGLASRQGLPVGGGEDLEEDAQAAPTPTHRPDIGGAQVEDGQDVRELVDALRSQLQSQGEELVARRREVQELHVLLQQKALPEAVGRPWWQV